MVRVDRASIWRLFDRVWWHALRPLRNPRVLGVATTVGWRVGRLRPSRSRFRRALVLAPPGEGNVGDLALIEAYARGLDGLCTVVVRSREAAAEVDALRIPACEVVSIPSLVYGTFFSHLCAVVQFSRKLSTVRSFSVIGADVMDGAYGATASVTRSRLLALAARDGIDSRVVSFSWNASPNAIAADALRNASRNGAVLYLRDPRSMERARVSGMLNTEQAADVVFTSRDRREFPEFERLAPTSSSGSLVLVNSSGLVARGGSVVDEYELLIRSLVERGCRVVFVPHVARAGNSDIEQNALVAERFANTPSVLQVDHLLAPPEVRMLVSRASMVVTGRMHLAVMAMNFGVPALTIATQGKVEGLMELFESPELCFNSELLAHQGELERRAVAVLTDLSRISDRVSGRTNFVRELASRNFAGLCDDRP